MSDDSPIKPKPLTRVYVGFELIKGGRAWKSEKAMSLEDFVEQGGDPGLLLLQAMAEVSVASGEEVIL